MASILKLGIDIAGRAVSRLMPKRRPEPSQTWRTFLANHRRRVIHFNVTVAPDSYLERPADRGRTPSWSRCATIGTVTDADYMDVALGEAHEAFARGDWPVGSVLVCDGAILATGQNRQNTERDVTWHAEFEAMRRVMRERGAEALVGATVYSTMEPCPMCAAAMKLVQIARLVLGTRHATLQRTDLGAYSVETFCALTGYDLNLTTGVREAECTALRRRWGRDASRPTA